MEECCLVVLRVQDGSRRRGVLMDRAGPYTRVLGEEGGVVVLAAIVRPDEVEEFLARLAGFDITEVVRSEPLRIGLRANRELEVVG